MGTTKQQINSVAENNVHANNMSPDSTKFHLGQGFRQTPLWNLPAYDALPIDLEL